MFGAAKKITASVMYYCRQILHSADICKSKCSEQWPVVITHLHTILTVARGFYELG